MIVYIKKYGSMWVLAVDLKLVPGIVQVNVKYEMFLALSSVSQEIADWGVVLCCFPDPCIFRQKGRKRGPLASSILEGPEEFEGSFDSLSSCGVGLKPVSSWLLHFLYNPCNKSVEIGEDEGKGDTEGPWGKLAKFVLHPCSGPGWMFVGCLFLFLQQAISCIRLPTELYAWMGIWTQVSRAQVS